MEINWMNTTVLERLKELTSTTFKKKKTTKQRRVGSERKAVSYLSLEMLQSMTVFLLVLTMMKGR